MIIITPCLTCNISTYVIRNNALEIILTVRVGYEIFHTEKYIMKEIGKSK